MCASPLQPVGAAPLSYVPETLTQSQGKPLRGLKTDLNIVVLVLTSLIFGRLLPTIILAFKIDKRWCRVDDAAIYARPGKLAADALHLITG